MKIVREIANILKIGQQYRENYMKTLVRILVAGEYSFATEVFTSLLRHQAVRIAEEVQHYVNPPVLRYVYTAYLVLMNSVQITVMVNRV